MRRRFRCIAGAFVALSTLSCTDDDPAYETAMRDWTNQACDCSRLPSSDLPACLNRIKEPAIPSSFFDKLGPHPKYYRVQRFYADARQACLEGVQAREGAHP